MSCVIINQLANPPLSRLLSPLTCQCCHPLSLVHSLRVNQYRTRLHSLAVGRVGSRRASRQLNRVHNRVLDQADFLFPGRLTYRAPDRLCNHRGNRQESQHLNQAKGLPNNRPLSLVHSLRVNQYRTRLHSLAVGRVGSRRASRQLNRVHNRVLDQADFLFPGRLTYRAPDRLCNHRGNRQESQHLNQAKGLPNNRPLSLVHSLRVSQYRTRLHNLAVDRVGSRRVNHQDFRLHSPLPNQFRLPLANLVFNPADGHPCSQRTSLAFDQVDFLLPSQVIYQVPSQLCSRQANPQ